MKKCESVNIKAKAILCFDETEEAKVAMAGWIYKYTIDEIWTQVFRPCFKHGYGDELLDSDEAYPIIEKLAEKYHQVLREELEERL